MIAAHSLGSVVVHNFLVRHWQTDAASVPDTLITFGSPIGVSAVDTATGLKGAGIEHRFLGPAKLTAVGSSHTEYFNDKEGFLALLLQAAGLAPDASEDVETGRSAREHWLRDLNPWDVAAFPYRLREAVLSLSGLSRDIDPMQPSPGYLRRLLGNIVSFTPALAGMAIPFAVTAWLTGHWPTTEDLWMRMWTLETLIALVLFMLYVVCCAAHELIRTWRQALRLLA